MAIVVGLALGLAGGGMQTILNNPLASPFTLGVSSAAAFGAALGYRAGDRDSRHSGQWFVSANAFIFALLAALLLDGITRWTQVATSGVILFGDRAGVYLQCAGIDAAVCRQRRYPPGAGVLDDGQH
ncbi:iron(III) dicitrate transport system permease protein FecD [Klebsiella michiganensis]|uniref:Iron(III) dicitrate transport system permease protein FecD n=1 Tax=Klebsiella michiganensis TaxID=1134687 RepID=A0A7H4LY25_9ENTR|nr:iron(III) dicitrate transport system permease protein FecD [Klebsiella michiganensis]